MSIETISILVLFLSFIGLLAYGVPVAYAIGISTTLTLIINIAFLPATTTAAHRMTTGIDNFALLAIPFFILAGEIMNTGGIAKRLNRFCQISNRQPPRGTRICKHHCRHALWGHFRVGCGRSIGHREVPLQIKWKKRAIPGSSVQQVNISSSTTGLLIPPSNVLIIFALASGGTASVAALFVAGYVPGILVGLALMIMVYVYAKRMKLPKAPRVGFKKLFLDFRRAILSLTLLIIVVGGIVVGVFTSHRSGRHCRSLCHNPGICT